MPSHRRPKVDKSDVNVFCFSKLWQNQMVSSSVCALEESHFVIPGQGIVSSSAEGRRNYTDAQETAHWLGGASAPEHTLADLLTGHLELFSNAHEQIYVFSVFLWPVSAQVSLTVAFSRALDYYFEVPTVRFSP